MRYFIVVLVLSLPAVSDSITVDGKTTSDVYVTESPTKYLVADPETGKSWTVSKDDATVTASGDRDELRAKYLKKVDSSLIKKTEPPKNLEPVEKKNEHPPMAPRVKQKEGEPIVMKEHGSFIPDPETIATIEANKYERFQAPTDRRIEAQQAAAERVRKQRQDEADDRQMLWQKYGVRPKDNHFKQTTLGEMRAYQMNQNR